MPIEICIFNLARLHSFQDELNEELEALEQEELDNQLLGVEEPSALPSVPTSSLPAGPSKGEILLADTSYHIRHRTI